MTAEAWPTNPAYTTLKRLRAEFREARAICERTLRSGDATPTLVSYACGRLAAVDNALSLALANTPILGEDRCEVCGAPPNQCELGCVAEKEKREES